jgi:peptidoglycan/LPS O-acetylase OafA/YrhL
MQGRPFLDKIRWLSAIVVALGHAIGILTDRLHGSHALNVIADMRGPAVIVFFVLSGYLVGGSVLRDFPNFDFRRYACARFARIYIVLVPALILTLLIDGFMRHLAPANPVFSSVWQGGAIGQTSIFSRYSAAHMIASVLCLEPLIAKPIGSAGTLWSLGNEWIYYFAFPLLTSIGYRLGGYRVATALAFGSIGAIALVSRMEAAFWFSWLCGAYASVFSFKPLIRSDSLLVAIKYLAFAICVTAIAIGSQIDIRAYLLAISLAGFIYLACGRAGEDSMSHSFDRGLARFSYSLYVTHLQLMSLGAAMLFRLGILPISGIASPTEVLALSTAMLVPCLIIAWLMAILFEDRTPALSLWLNRRFATTAGRASADAI